MATRPQSAPCLSYFATLLLLLLLQYSPPPLAEANNDGSSQLIQQLENNTFIYSNCSTSVDNSSTTYRQNLELLFQSLIDSVSSTGFYNTSEGEGSDTAYGPALCRGDLSGLPADVCRNCTAKAAEKVKADCGNKRSAMIWLGSCLLRFSDTRFFGRIGGNEKVAIGGRNLVASPADKDALRDFMDDLMNDTVGNQMLFATKIEQRDGSTSYGMAQCTRDLTPADCKLCLENATQLMDKSQSLSQEFRFLSESCAMGYDPRPLFLLSPSSPSSGQAAPLPLSPSPPPLPSLSSTEVIRNGITRKKMISIIASIVGMLALLATCICMLLFRSRKTKTFEEELRRYSSQMVSLDGLTMEERDHELPQYSLKAVQAATNNFSEDNKLGRGGFGPVYRGELNGRLVAVKRLSQRSGQGLKEFMNEVILIAKLQHKNLVRLLGCCTERGEKMLIYEFMPNGSLDTFLHDPQKRNSLDWTMRFNIIMGSARGIMYLHHDSRLNIIHRDLKAGNVLLDEQMAAKISDFGMARIFSGDKDPRATNVIVGTHGYMAPEYALDGQFSIKSDVYSFGVLLLEIVSGQTYSGFHISHTGCTLIEYAWTLWSRGEISDFIDPMLGESATSSQVLKCLQIGLLCVQEDPTRRPTMLDIINMLGSDAPNLPTPQQPPLVNRSRISNSSNSITSKDASFESGSTNS
ncbi:unnamed protein product [Victoria cruziana]